MHIKLCSLFPPFPAHCLSLFWKGIVLHYFDSNLQPINLLRKKNKYEGMSGAVCALMPCFTSILAAKSYLWEMIYGFDAQLIPVKWKRKYFVALIAVTQLNTCTNWVWSEKFKVSKHTISYNGIFCCTNKCKAMNYINVRLPVLGIG